MSWTNRNPVNTPCEVLIGGEWKRGRVDGYSPDHIRINWSHTEFKTLRIDEEFRVRFFNYEFGLRRGLELAKEHALLLTHDPYVDWSAAEKAIEDEAAK